MDARRTGGGKLILQTEGTHAPAPKKRRGSKVAVKKSAARTRKKKDADTRGERVCKFIEKFCRQPEGDGVGQPMELLPFQRKFILDVYDNPRGTRRAYLSMAKKNGKTSIISAILLAHIVGPEAKRNTQIVSGAQSREQAAQVFNLAVKMIAMHPTLTKLTRVVPSNKRIVGLAMNVEYKALSAEGKNTHGISPALAILDEVGQVAGPRDEFVSAITTSQGAYDDPLLIAISTQAANDADMFSLWIDTQESSPDPRVVSHVYSAPPDCALDDKDAWKIANPALGKFKKLSDLEAASLLAMRIPSNEPEFRNFSLNQRVERTSPFVSKQTWEDCGGEPGTLEGKKVYGGLDLSSVHDLCALVLVSDAGDVECHFWLPAVGLREKARKDKVPWDLWADQGFLHTTPGRAVEYSHVAEFMRGLFDRLDVEAVAFDRWNFKHLRPWLVEAQFTDSEIEKFKEFGQGTASMTPALRELEVRLLNKRLRHGMNPILKMCAANAVTVGDATRTQKLIKDGSGVDGVARKFDKVKARGRIDGMVALAMAVGVMPSGPEDAKEPSMFFI